MPTFLLGLALLGGVWVKSHCHGKGCSGLCGRDIELVRKELQKTDGNPESAANLLRKLLEQKEQVGNRLAKVYFLLGTAELRQADHAEPAQAQTLYQGARRDLQEAKRLGVAANDQGPLRYRLARAAFWTGEDPAAVVQQLAESVDLAEEREKAEAYILLTEAYLRLTPPDYKAALAANEKLRKDIAMVPEEVLAPARLRGGELLLKLPGAARKPARSWSALVPWRPGPSRSGRACSRPELPGGGALPGSARPLENASQRRLRRARAFHAAWPDPLSDGHLPPQAGPGQGSD